MKKNREKSPKQRMNRDILIVTYIFVLIFVAIAAYYIYYVNVRSEEYIASTYNTRQDLQAERVLRGDILARDGTVLVTSNETGDGQERIYPYGGMYAQVLGYYGHGKAGVERVYNHYLWRCHVNMFEQIAHTARGELNEGDSVVTTLDPRLQEIAYDMLRQYDGGAVVALDPATGEILCMASWPSFDPNEISAIWDEINEDETSSVLVNRATSGYYMPGSTFKIVDALAAYRQYGAGIEDALYYDCEGAVTLQDAVTAEELRVACDSDIAHGTVNMRGAFARSCNGYFITLGSQLDLRTWRETAEDLLYNGEIDFALSNASGRFTLDGESGTWETMLTAIGQGDTLVTPLQNAMISAAVANGGTVMRPVIVNEIRTSGGTHVRDFRHEEMARLMTEDEAAFLRELMTAVVNEGTATNMQSPYYQAAGKTGTAQNTSAPGDSNALFTGFAPADAAPGERQIVVSVVVENGGRVHGSATEIASAIFDEWLVNR